MRPGDMVACVTDGPCAPVTRRLYRGQVYRIRTRKTYTNGYGWQGEGVTIEEVRNGLNPIGDEYAYPAAWFRPVKEPDIGALRKMVEALTA